MKLKSLLIIGGLSLALGASALAGISANKVNKEVVETSAYSKSGLTLVTSENISTYAGYDAVILSDRTNSPKYQLAWNGTSLYMPSTGVLFEYQITDVNGTNFSLKYKDDNHYFGSWYGYGFKRDSAHKAILSFDNGSIYEKDEDNTYFGWYGNGDGTATFESGYSSFDGAYLGEGGLLYLYAITDQAIRDATTFSREFLQKTSGYCNAEVSEENINAIKYSWTHLSLGASEAFYTAELVRGVGQVYSSDRSEAYSRYVNMAIEMGYGNFLEIQNLNPSSTNVINLSGSTDVIVIASVTAIVALAFTTLLLLKKKKAN